MHQIVKQTQLSRHLFGCSLKPSLTFHFDTTCAKHQVITYHPYHVAAGLWIYKWPSGFSASINEYRIQYHDTASRYRLWTPESDEASQMCQSLMTAATFKQLDMDLASG